MSLTFDQLHDRGKVRWSSGLFMVERKPGRKPPGLHGRQPPDDLTGWLVLDVSYAGESRDLLMLVMVETFPEPGVPVRWYRQWASEPFRVQHRRRDRDGDHEWVDADPETPMFTFKPPFGLEPDLADAGTKGVLLEQARKLWATPLASIRPHWDSEAEWVTWEAWNGSVLCAHDGRTISAGPCRLDDALAEGQCIWKMLENAP